MYRHIYCTIDYLPLYILTNIGLPLSSVFHHSSYAKRYLINYIQNRVAFFGACPINSKQTKRPNVQLLGKLT